MKIARCGPLASTLLCSGLPLNGQVRAQAQPSDKAATEFGRIVVSPDRSAADRSNDLRRKPEAMLGFIDAKPGMVALDPSTAGGYTTELLARTIGAGGVVYGQSLPPRDTGQASTPPPRVTATLLSHPALRRGA